MCDQQSNALHTPPPPPAHVLGWQLQHLLKKGREAQAGGTDPPLLRQPPQRMRRNVVKEQHPYAGVGQAEGGVDLKGKYGC